MVSEKFHHFLSLPTELRQLIYSKMEPSERIGMARTSQEGFQYFSEKRNRLDMHTAFLYVSEVDGRAAITVKYSSGFTERFYLPSEETAKLSRELSDYPDCQCEWCDGCSDNWENYSTFIVGLSLPYSENEEGEEDEEMKREVDIRVFPWISLDNALLSLRLFNMENMYIRTYPYGGFMETLSPSLPLDASYLAVYWHLKERKDLGRPLNIAMWNQWLGKCDEISFDVDYGGAEFTRNVHQDVFGINAVMEANVIVIKAVIGINFEQMSRLKASSLMLEWPQLSEEDAQLYRKQKIKEWLQNPSVQFYSTIPVKTVDSEKMLADVGDLLANPDIVFRLTNNWPRKFTFKDLKTDTILKVSEHSLHSYDSTLFERR